MSVIYIYSIFNQAEPNTIYIGSTNNIGRRMRQHKYRFKIGKLECSSKIIFNSSNDNEFKDIKFNIINEVYIINNDKKVKFEIERQMIELYKNMGYNLVNKLRPVISKQELIKLQKECIKKYNENNKNKISQYYKKRYENNKNKIKEQNKKYYENNKNKKKEYYENNKNKILQQQREQKKKWREANKEQINQRQRELYKKLNEANKEQINKRRRELYKLRKEQQKQNNIIENQKQNNSK